MYPSLFCFFMGVFVTVGIVNKLCNEKCVDTVSWYMKIRIAVRNTDKSNAKASACFLSPRGLVGVRFLKCFVWSGSAWRLFCLPGVSSWDALYVLRSEADLSFSVPLVSPTLVYSEYTCWEMLSFFVAI